VAVPPNDQEPTEDHPGRAIPPEREEKNVTPTPTGGEDTDPYRAPNLYAAAAYALLAWGLIAAVVFIPWARVVAAVALLVVALVVISRRWPLS
jgi:hypothetical protein